MNAITIDCVIFGFDNGILEVLLVEHAEGISKGKWALPGGWIKKKESIDDAAHAAAVLFNQIQLAEDAGYLLVAQVRFVVAGFDFFNSQAVHELAGVKKLDAVVKHFDGGVV